jgi:hypothetical protein
MFANSETACQAASRPATAVATVPTIPMKAITGFLFDHRTSSDSGSGSGTLASHLATQARSGQVQAILGLSFLFIKLPVGHDLLPGIKRKSIRRRDSASKTLRFADRFPLRKIGTRQRLNTALRANDLRWELVTYCRNPNYRTSRNLPLDHVASLTDHMIAVGIIDRHELSFAGAAFSSQRFAQLKQAVNTTLQWLDEIEVWQ